MPGLPAIVREALPSLVATRSTMPVCSTLAASRYVTVRPIRSTEEAVCIASAIFVLFDVYEQDGVHALFSVPEAAFELSFAIYLIVKGFRPSPILSGPEERVQA